MNPANISVDTVGICILPGSCQWSHYQQSSNSRPKHGTAWYAGM